MPQERRLIENKHCSLLSLEENQHISRLLGARCKTLATTIIQLFHTQPPNHQQWLKRDTGVLCFVRDSIKKNYFFRLFCLRRNCMTWEQEMYNGMVYSDTCPYLHTFEGDESMIAFNFVSEEEANELYKIVTTKLLTKKKREEQSSANNIIGSSLSSRNKSATLKPTSFSSDPEAKKAKRKRNITKADIGQPLEFRHISHIGWDRDKGFAFNTEDKQLHEFFHKAGVSEKHLQDTETRNFIYDFIQKNGGRDAVERNITKKPPPPPTTAQTGPPVPPRGGARTLHNRAAPPPPSATPPRPQPQPPRGIMGGIPPPPPGNAPPPPPCPPLNGSLPLPPLGGSSAPPPPPPPPPLTELPPPVVAPSTNDSPGDLRSALFDSIREGATLKPVDSEQKNNVTRDDVFSDIRKGVMLKPVGEREIKPPTPNNEGVDLADALKRALVERNRVIHPDDDDDDDTSDTNSNDEEWE